jgi:hypothetical protein
MSPTQTTALSAYNLQFATLVGGVAYNVNACEPVDVFYRYGVIHKLYFAFFIVQWVRFVFIFLAALVKKPGLAKAMEGLGCLNGCLGFANLIILHV